MINKKIKKTSWNKGLTKYTDERVLRNSISVANSEKPVWNKGLTKKSDERVLKMSITLSERMLQNDKIGHPHTEETKEKLRNHAIKNKLGGHVSKKRINYKGVNLHSSYEYDVAKSLDDNKIKWMRPSYFMWKDLNDIEHRYYPDFYLPEYDVYLDPKNDYLIKKDFIKIKTVALQNNIKLFVLNKNELNWDSIKCLIDMNGGVSVL